MKPHGRVFALAALSAMVALFLFAGSASARCGDGVLGSSEECEVGILCDDPVDICDLSICRCSPGPYCGDTEINQPTEECEVGVLCADPTWTCDEITCLCSPPKPECGDGTINQDWEQCEVDVPCTETGYTCDESTCLCSPPTGGEGCTPGYWKQRHHFDSWEATGYDPYQTVMSAFGAIHPSVDELSLRQALRLRGGGLKAMMRHAVAALLNAAHPDVSYAYSTSEVIAMVTGEMSAEEIEDTKDALADENEEGCPLN